jgi:Fe-Mn family superoxide dismutase
MSIEVKHGKDAIKSKDEKTEATDPPKFTQPPLPWARDSLVNFLSAETINYHYDGHHKGYYDMLNALAAKDKKLAKMSLNDIVSQLPAGQAFNNGAQAWNHDFYWKSLSPKGGGDPSGEVGKMIIENWKTIDAFKKEFIQVSLNHFASGWTWLIQGKGRKLYIISLPNAENPLSKHSMKDEEGSKGHGGHPLLCLDLWEHAYYVDYRINREEYANRFWSYVNWGFANENVVTE